MKELVIRYSDYDGSSKGIREWMRTNLVQFAQSNPDLAVKTELKRCVHPFVRGNYMNGNSKTICIKNLQPENITGYVNDLRNQIGRKVRSQLFICSVLGDVKSIMHYAFTIIHSFVLSVQSGTNGYKKPVLTKCTSVQGEWHERMDLIGLELKVVQK